MKTYEGQTFTKDKKPNFNEPALYNNCVFEQGSVEFPINVNDLEKHGCIISFSVFK